MHTALATLEHPYLLDKEFTTTILSWWDGGLHFFKTNPGGETTVLIDLYYFSYFIAFAIGYVVFSRWQKRGEIKVRRYQVQDITIVMVLGVLLGAKTAYVLFYNLEYYLEHPEQIFTNWSGMASHGALFGSMIALYIWAKKAKANYLHVIDNIAALAWLPAIFIRATNFLNHELYGRSADPETVPWAMRFPMRDEFGRSLYVQPAYSETAPERIFRLIRYDPETLQPLKEPYFEFVNEPLPHAHESAQWMLDRFGAGLNGDGAYAHLSAVARTGPAESDSYALMYQLVTDPSHPSQLYQLLIGGVLVGIVMMIARARAVAVGTLTGMFLVSYGIARLCTEYWRQQDFQRADGVFQYISMGQILSLTLIVGGLFVWWYRSQRPILVSEVPLPPKPMKRNKHDDWPGTAASDKADQSVEGEQNLSKVSEVKRDE